MSAATPSALPQSVDVLVVGAGPTGLMLATQLARRDVRVAIIDRNDGPSVRTKALGVHARTLEIYAKLGVADAALELGRRTIAARMWGGGRPLARVPIGDIGHGISPYPFILVLGQDDNERLLGQSLRRHGSDVRWGHELVGLEQRSGRVTATVRRSDGSTLAVDAAWVAGCDGAHSAVRDRCGIGFPGAPYEHVFFVADTVATGPMAEDELNIYLFRGGFHLFFPMRGRDHWRVVGIVPKSLRARDDVTFDDMIAPMVEEVGRQLQFDRCTWFATYRIHHRRAERFRQGRCFLLGDAAHIHSPVGAQGMNTGLQDAHNLAWKLALVASGSSRESLLDSYESERVPVADRLVATTDRLFSIIVSEGWLAGLWRTALFPKVVAGVMRWQRARELVFRTISQVGIRYPTSTLSHAAGATTRGAPRPGDRFPWLQARFGSSDTVEDIFERFDDTSFNLVVVGQPAPASEQLAVGVPIAVHAIDADPRIAASLGTGAEVLPAYYLVRPDGYIGLAGRSLDPAEIRRYLRERVGVIDVSNGRAGGDRSPRA